MAAHAKLTSTQRAALAYILRRTQEGNLATAELLAAELDTSEHGAHRTAASLVRLGLAAKTKAAVDPFSSAQRIVYTSTEAGRLTITRQPKDRTTVKEMKIPRRSKIKHGTELHVEGIRGRVTFVGHTKVTSGPAKDYVEVLDSKGRSRLVDPAKITQVHRTKKVH